MPRQREKAEDDWAYVYDVLDKSGWILEVEKSDETRRLQQIKGVFGICRQYSSMTNEEKKHRILDQVWTTIRNESSPIAAKELARLLER